MSKSRPWAIWLTQCAATGLVAHQPDPVDKRARHIPPSRRWRLDWLGCLRAGSGPGGGEFRSPGGQLDVPWWPRGWKAYATGS